MPFADFGHFLLQEGKKTLLSSLRAILFFRFYVCCGVAGFSMLMQYDKNFKIYIIMSHRRGCVEKNGTKRGHGKGEI